MKPHPSNATRHPVSSRQSTWPVDAKMPQTIPQQPQTSDARLARPPASHVEKSISRRPHRKPTANYLGVSLSWLDKLRLRVEASRAMAKVVRGLRHQRSPYRGAFEEVAGYAYAVRPGLDSAGEMPLHSP